MKIVKHFVIIVFIGLSLFSCKKENNACLKGTGKQSSEHRTLPQQIGTVELMDNINLYITQDSVNSIRIEAGENLIDFIETEMNGNVLTIKNNNKCNFLRSFKKDINVYLTLNEIDSIQAYGSGNITMTDTFTTEKITFNLHQFTGDILAKLNCSVQSRFNAHQTVSKVTVLGYSRYNIAYNSGNGWFYMKDLKTHYHQINSNSTGDCIAGEVHTMFIHIKSSGNIIYYGNPVEIEYYEYTGDGKLIKAN